MEVEVVAYSKQEAGNAGLHPLTLILESVWWQMSFVRKAWLLPGLNRILSTCSCVVGVNWRCAISTQIFVFSFGSPTVYQHRLTLSSHPSSCVIPRRRTTNSSSFYLSLQCSPHGFLSVHLTLGLKGSIVLLSTPLAFKHKQHSSSVSPKSSTSLISSYYSYSFKYFFSQYKPAAERWF